MPIALIFLAGVLVGSVVTLLAAGFNEKLVDAGFSVVRFFVRPSVPFWVWTRNARQTSSFYLRRCGGEKVDWVTDGNDWVAVFTADGRRVGFSPLLLAPAGLVRLAVRLLGRETAFSLPNRPTEGYIVRGLTVAPGLMLARRRAEDLAYLAQNARFPTTSLPTV